MTDHYAASLLLSQGAYDCRATAHLIFASGNDETLMEIEWPTVPPQSQPENPGEWLFYMLEEMVANFDAHAVKSASRRPRGSGRTQSRG